ncbi:unnamed protein product [Prorocentrum cordatum]|uniref:Protein kinase domain-containing protein n=1 Tax=Prorocentrum cordatum TaxID=2364126 RepID=A0ABN9STM0_9DINO|nr:unnamed protein product [Polarella glacialis]
MEGIRAEEAMGSPGAGARSGGRGPDGLQGCQQRRRTCPGALLPFRVPPGGAPRAPPPWQHQVPRRPAETALSVGAPAAGVPMQMSPPRSRAQLPPPAYAASPLKGRQAAAAQQPAAPLLPMGMSPTRCRPPPQGQQQQHAAPPPLPSPVPAGLRAQPPPHSQSFTLASSPAPHQQQQQHQPPRPPQQQPPQPQPSPTQPQLAAGQKPGVAATLPPSMAQPLQLAAHSGPLRAAPQVPQSPPAQAPPVAHATPSQPAPKQQHHQAAQPQPVPTQHQLSQSQPSSQEGAAAPPGPLQPQQAGAEGRPRVPPLKSISLTKPPPELPAALVADFQDENELLGEGAFAVVCRLRHRRTGDPVALKVVEKYPLHIRNMLPQLQREVRIQGSLQHRHILRLLTCHEDDAYVYMVLENCAGGSLRSLCAAQPGHRLPEARAARYFAQILQGVDFMHQRSCVHRDLKPENMLLTGDDEAGRRFGARERGFRSRGANEDRALDLEFKHVVEQHSKYVRMDAEQVQAQLEARRGELTRQLEAAHQDVRAEVQKQCPEAANETRRLREASRDLEAEIQRSIGNIPQAIERMGDKITQGYVYSTASLRQDCEPARMLEKYFHLVMHYMWKERELGFQDRVQFRVVLRNMLMLLLRVDSLPKILLVVFQKLVELQKKIDKPVASPGQRGQADASKQLEISVANCKDIPG